MNPFEVETQMPLYWVNRMLFMERLEQEYAAHEQRRQQREARAVAWQQERLSAWR